MDAVRYWLLHEVPPAGDTDYTEASFARAYTRDLANDLGNLFQRTLTMAHRYRSGVVPEHPAGERSRLEAMAAELPATIERALGGEWDPRLALDGVLALAREANRFVEDARPWVLARAEREGDEHARRRLDAVLRDLLEALRVIAEGLRPFLPDTAARMAAQLGAAPAWRPALEWGSGRAGSRVAAPVVLFPKRAPSTG